MQVYDDFGIDDAGGGGAWATCKKCKKVLPEKAAICPHCDHHFSAQEIIEMESKTSESFWVSCVVGLVVFGGIFYFIITRLQA